MQALRVASSGADPSVGHEWGCSIRSALLAALRDIEGEGANVKSLLLAVAVFLLSTPYVREGREGAGMVLFRMFSWLAVL